MHENNQDTQPQADVQADQPWFALIPGSPREHTVSYWKQLDTQDEARDYAAGAVREGAPFAYVTAGVYKMQTQVHMSVLMERKPNAEAVPAMDKEKD